MNIFHLENLKIKLENKLKAEKFPINRLELLNLFMNEVFKTNDRIIIEAYISELLSEYLTTLQNITPFGLEPKKINESIGFFKKLNTFIELSNIDEQIPKEVERILSDYNYVEETLKGNSSEFNKDLISFPVNIHTLKSEIKFGQIETFSIKIHKETNLVKNNFIIIPSKEKIDDRLETQINISWNLAMNYLKRFYQNPSKYHEVILIFQHKYAELEGFSLGMSITIGFIQELFRFYNTSLSLNLKRNVTFTGGMCTESNVIPLGKEIIELKVETVFYSYFDFFAIPEADYISAKEKLISLKKVYPNRNLKLIPIEDFDDLINHRQIISIDKAKLADRTKKIVKAHSLSLILISILIVVLAGIALYTMDNNPYEFQIVGKSLNVLNKSGKILWSKPIGLEPKIRINEGKYFQRIYDIDGDGRNEVIIAHEFLKERDAENNGRIACFDHTGKLIWKYKFADTISTIRESYSDIYVSRIVDIAEYNGNTVLFCNARHLYFPSAIYPLDIKTGKRLDGILWSQGHFYAGNIGDYNNDNELELFIGGINNGLESAFACIINLSDLNGQTPTTKNYLFENIPLANFKKYFVFPKTDLCIYGGRRFNGTELTKFYKSTNTYDVGVNEKFNDLGVGAYYVFNYNLDSVHLRIGDSQQFVRDSLIVKGFLKPPFTTDPEYEKILVSKINEWDGKKFIPFINVK